MLLMISGHLYYDASQESAYKTKEKLLHHRSNRTTFWFCRDSNVQKSGCVCDDVLRVDLFPQF